MAIRGVQECVRNLITNRATLTLPDEHAVVRIVFGRHLGAASAALDELDAATIREAHLSKSMNFTG
jgi:hypothetical protein